ncbi:MAG: hypothetical protein AB8F78_13610 [Saprospiraceae bacterium]
MNLLPLENIIYETQLAPAEIQARLAEVIEPLKYFRKKDGLSNKNLKAYQGWLSEDSFEVSRLITYRNSFLPQINGTIQKYSGGTKVFLKISLHPAILIFVLLIFGVLFLMCLVVLVSLDSKPFEWVMLGPFGMFLFLATIVIGAFNAESQKSKKFFAELFEAEAT